MEIKVQSDKEDGFFNFEEKETPCAPEIITIDRGNQRFELSFSIVEDEFGGREEEIFFCVSKIRRNEEGKVDLTEVVYKTYCN